MCKNWCNSQKGDCNTVVNPLELKLRVHTYATLWLLHSKSIVVHRDPNDKNYSLPISHSITFSPLGHPNVHFITFFSGLAFSALHFLPLEDCYIFCLLKGHPWEHLIMFASPQRYHVLQDKQDCDCAFGCRKRQLILFFSTNSLKPLLIHPLEGRKKKMRGPYMAFKFKLKIYSFIYIYIYNLTEPKQINVGGMQSNQKSVTQIQRKKLKE